MFTKSVCLIAIAIIGSVSTATCFQATQDIKSKPTPFMQRKLDNSRNIVAGLATEDYSLISKSAQDLMLLSHEAEWNVVTTPAYLKMSSEFRGSAERLRDNARAKNLDGATLAYFEVTLNCVRCHKHLRKSPPSKKTSN